MANILLETSQGKNCHKSTMTTLLNLGHVLKVMSSDFDKVRNEKEDSGFVLY